MTERLQPLKMFWRILLSTLAMPWQGIGVARERLSFLASELAEAIRETLR